MDNKSDAPVSQSAEDAGSNPVQCGFDSPQVHQVFCDTCGYQLERCIPPCTSCGSYNATHASDK